MASITCWEATGFAFSLHAPLLVLGPNPSPLTVNVPFPLMPLYLPVPAESLKVPLAVKWKKQAFALTVCDCFLVVCVTLNDPPTNVNRSVLVAALLLFSWSIP